MNSSEPAITEDADHLARTDVERHAVNRAHAAECFREIRYLDHVTFLLSRTGNLSVIVDASQPSTRARQNHWEG